MKILKTILELKQWREEQNQNIGFVPTMGCLHQGHLSLVEKSKLENELTVVSIFLNPLQFNSTQDLKNYPVQQKIDLDLCEKKMVDAVFLPQKEDLTPTSLSTRVQVYDLDETLCGQTRGCSHFEGVCFIVLKLLNLVQPTKMYLGEKDFQQLAILKKMVEDLSVSVEVIGVPTVRDSLTGVVLSSRNQRLSKSGLKKIENIYKALVQAKKLFFQGERDIKVFIACVQNILLQSCEKIDYIQIVDEQSLQILEKINQPAILVVAVLYEEVRFVDYIRL